MIDFRSDTVTRPTQAMQQAMYNAPLGDDVFSDDPSVNALQEFAADKFGFAGALFAPSGTMTNLIALMSHCQRGDEAIVGQNWHTYKWEGGGMAVLGSIQPQPLPHQADGSIALADIALAIKPDDPHFAKTRLVVIENTTGGQVLPLSYMQSVAELAKQKQLSAHIDGARIMNAAVAIASQQGSDVWQCAKALVAGYDSVSVCLSKGLGAPVGSLLLGDSAFLQRAKRVRKMLGGGMRQAGMLAAAGQYALTHNVTRLMDDHNNAATLAAGLTAIATELQLGSDFLVSTPQTNIIFCDLAAPLAQYFVAELATVGIACISSSYQAGDATRCKLRLVTHLDISSNDIEITLMQSRRILAAFK
jgi:threonine aldolase